MSKQEKLDDITYAVMQYNYNNDDGELEWAVSVELNKDNNLSLQLIGPKQEEIDYKGVLYALVEALNNPVSYKFLNDIGHAAIDKFLLERKTRLQ